MLTLLFNQRSGPPTPAGHIVIVQGESLVRARGRVPDADGVIIIRHPNRGRGRVRGAEVEVRARGAVRVQGRAGIEQDAGQVRAQGQLQQVGRASLRPTAAARVSASGRLQIQAAATRLEQPQGWMSARGRMQMVGKVAIWPDLGGGKVAGRGHIEDWDLEMVAMLAAVV